MARMAGALGVLHRKFHTAKNVYPTWPDPLALWLGS
jgi:hypothetical protein